MPKKKSLYTPHQNEAFELSRSKLQLFMECPRCFYLDRSERFRKSRPSGPMSYIPTAIDLLLKSDFDKYRKLQQSHPYLISNKINLVPFNHEDIDDWRNNRKGARYHDFDTNLIIYGSIDDCWFDIENNKLHLVDYKTTTASYEKDASIKKVDLDEKGAPHKFWYKKQIEIYSWIFKKKGFDISDTAFFLFCSALYKGKESFDNRLDFKIDIIKYQTNDSWVDDTIKSAKKTLDLNEPPEVNTKCTYCNYINS